MAVIAIGTVMSKLPSRVLDTSQHGALEYDTLALYLTKGLAPGNGSLLRQAIQVSTAQAFITRGSRADTIEYDSLVVADSEAYPSLRAGGFLSDEIARYNRYQERRLERIRHVPGSRRIPSDLTGSANASIFRTTHRLASDGSDTLVLAERPVLSGMRVASPFDNPRTVYVTTKDAPTSMALVSPLGTALLTRGGLTPTHRPCPIFALRDSIAIQCLSHASPDISGGEFVVHFDGVEPREGVAVSRVGTARYDGAILRTGAVQPIHVGGILQLASSGGRAGEPVAVESAVGGTLIGTQWVNGQMQWRTNPEFDTPLLRQLAGGAGFGVLGSLPDRSTIPLTMDERITLDLQKSLEKFVATAPQTQRNLAFAVVVLARARTGEIVAIAEVNDRESDEPSWVFRPVNVGSAIKPLIATAVLMQRPEFASLAIWDPGKSVTELWGLPLQKSFESGCDSDKRTGWIGLRRFIGCSSNLFAASLVAASLERPGTPISFEDSPGLRFQLGGRTISGKRPHIAIHSDLIAQDTLANSLLAAGLYQLDNLTTSMEYAGGVGRVGRDSSAWRGLTTADGKTPVRVPPGLWPEVSRLALAPSGASASLRALAGYAIGTGENQISPLQLSEAFGRIVLDRRLTLSFVPLAPNAQPTAGSLGLSAKSWYNELTLGLRDVGRAGGTAPFLAASLQSHLGPSFEFYGKTGTIDEPGKPFKRHRSIVVEIDGKPETQVVDVLDTLPPVVAKTLVFGVGKKGTSGAALDCGVIGTAYFRLATNRGISRVDPLAAQYARDALWSILARHWARLRLCD
jgi:hypothetical protein